MRTFHCFEHIIFLHKFNLKRQNSTTKLLSTTVHFKSIHLLKRRGAKCPRKGHTVLWPTFFSSVSVNVELFIINKCFLFAKRFWVITFFSRIYKLSAVISFLYCKSLALGILTLKLGKIAAKFSVGNQAQFAISRMSRKVHRI